MTAFGIVHTVISMIAVVAGLVALVRDRRIGITNRLGRLYVLMTVLTCVTALGIFHHGGFNAAHQLAIITLGTLALAAVAGKTRLFGRASPYIETVAYSATFFFHMIPLVTETSTRLPVGAPLLAGADAPALKTANAVLLLCFVIGATLQVVRLWGTTPRRLPTA